MKRNCHPISACGIDAAALALSGPAVREDRFAALEILMPVKASAPVKP